MKGRDGNDFLVGGPGNDELSGDAGNDFLSSIDGVILNDRLNGGPHANGDTCESDPDFEADCEF